MRYEPQKYSEYILHLTHFEPNRPYKWYSSKKDGVLMCKRSKNLFPLNEQIVKLKLIKTEI